MMREVKKIDVDSTARITAVISAIWGFISVLIWLIFVLPFAGMASWHMEYMNWMMFPGTVAVFGIGYIVLTPLFMAVAGYILGALSAFFYNESAKRIGGIKLDL